MRTNLRDSIKPDMLAPNTRPKIIARNTFRYTAPDGATVIRLHRTDIVKQRAGKTTLDSGGWRTSTTKARMQDHMPPGYRLYANKGSWYIRGGDWQDASAQTVPYYDGITLPFTAKVIKRATAQEAREQKERAAIRKFVRKLDTLERLPEPSASDCWLCSMFQLEPIRGQAKGMECVGDNTTAPAGDTGHLREHIREGYLHGSLILNALAAAGYAAPGFIFAMEQRDMAHGRKPALVKRALRRYLYRKLGLVA